MKHSNCVTPSARGYATQAWTSASRCTLEEAGTVLQILLGYVRQRKAFTLPKGRVQPSAPAFGRVTADIAYVLRLEGIRNTNGWLPRINKDPDKGTDNIITDYLRRALSVSRNEALHIGEKIWVYLITRSLLIGNKGRWKLDHERLFVVKATQRYMCNRCGIVTSYSAKSCCPRKSCEGRLELRAFDPAHENAIARWVSGTGEPEFFTLKSEEHTAQIDKNLAKQIEDRFRAEGILVTCRKFCCEMRLPLVQAMFSVLAVPAAVSIRIRCALRYAGEPNTMQINGAIRQV